MKERLVGAAVLVTLGVVLIPLLLDGPAREAPTRTGLELPAADIGTRRHIIEIKRDSAVPAGPAVASRAGHEAGAAPTPTSSEAGPVARPGRSPEPAASEPAASEVAAAEGQAAGGATARQRVAPAPTPAKGGAPSPDASSPPAAGGWAVQVGSFGSRDNADKLRRRLGAEGYPVFLMQVVSGGKTYHRVRVGPYGDRAGADAAARRLAASGPGGTVVRHEG